MTNTILMMEQSFPTMNDIIGASKQVKRGKKFYSGFTPMKRKFDGIIVEALNKQHCIPEKPYDKIKLSIIYTESRKKRDPDNISAGFRKFLLDAMVKAGVIVDDSIDHVQEFNERFHVGDARKVSVVITEAR